MEKIKQILGNRIILVILIAVLVLAVTAVIVAVTLGGPDQTDDGTKPTGETTYTVSLRTEGGLALSDVDVYVYTDNTLQDLFAVQKTDETGAMTFTAATLDSYAVVLKGVPAGYPIAASYPVTGQNTQITLAAQLANNVDLNAESFTVGSVMFDFTVTDTEGTAYTLSELLKTKKAVVLNFWYTRCNPCKAEFPFLQQAWEARGEDIALLAVNPVDADDSAIAQFRTEMDLTMPMAKVDALWEKAFGLAAYPTTVVIDRYGVISLVHAGSIDNAETFQNMFAYFTAEDYAQKTGVQMDDFVAQTEQGTAENPLEFGGVTEFEVTVQPGKSVYCHVYKVSGMVLTVADPSIQLTYGEKNYLPENGVITLPVESADTYTPVKLVFTNTGTQEKTYCAKLSFPAGTIGNPHKLEMGNLTVDVAAGNDQGVYYTYIAPETGELTVLTTGATEGVEFTFTLYNLNTYVYKALGTEEAANLLTIAVNQGDEVQFTAGTLPNADNEYPAAKLDFVISFEKKEVDIPTEPPTGPTEPPTEPTEPPTEPTEPPTEPTEPPTEPTEPPTQPTEPPTQPTEPPTQPTEPPTQPTEPPTQPTEPPTQPTEPPTQPTEPEGEGNGEYTELYVGPAYHIALGQNRVNLRAGELTYFLFTPEQSGQYRFSCGEGVLSYYGNNLFFIQDQTALLEGYTENGITVNIKDSNLGSSYLIGITAATKVTGGSLTVTRVGDQVLSWDDLPYETYAGVYTPTPWTFNGGILKYVNINGKASDYVFVLGSDGFYHLNSADGPLLYLNLKQGQYMDCALNTMLHSNRPVIQGTVKDDNGNNVSKEQYNDLVQKYIDCSDQGLYPLTPDLVRILKTQNDNWYLYLSSMNSRVQKDMAWMCNICYVEQ